MVPCRCSAMTRASSGSPASRMVYPRALRISELSCRTPFSSSTSSTVSVPRGSSCDPAGASVEVTDSVIRGR